MTFRVKDLLINLVPSEGPDARRQCVPEHVSGLCKATYLVEDQEDGSGKYNPHVYCTISCDESVPPNQCGAHKCSPVQEFQSLEDVSTLRKLLREALEELERRESELRTR